jgi:Ran GTPase-activating protein (RanGAP) involved in mRNA processing and transport
MHLKASVMSSISKLLLEKTTNLKRFGIIDNPISDAGAVWVAQALQNNATITELDLTDCHFAKKPSWLAPKTGTTELATVLKNTLTLTSLKLAGNMIQPKSIKEFVEGLKTNKTLTYLDLSNNQIADEGMIHISNGLQTNKTLEILLLGNNGITDKGAETISGFIPNTAVGCLALEYNQIGDKGCQLITGALRKGSRIHTLIFRGNAASVDLVAELYQVCPAGQTHESGEAFGRTIKL